MKQRYILIVGAVFSWSILTEEFKLSKSQIGMKNDMKQYINYIINSMSRILPDRMVFGYKNLSNDQKKRIKATVITILLFTLYMGNRLLDNRMAQIDTYSNFMFRDYGIFGLRIWNRIPFLDKLINPTAVYTTLINDINQLSGFSINH